MILLFVLVMGVSPSFTAGEAISENTARATPLNHLAVNSNSHTFDLPDLYVIVVDGFGGKECLDKVYGYDDEPFYTFLEQQGLPATRKIARQTFREDFVDSLLKRIVLRQGLQDRHRNGAIIRTFL